MTSTTVLLLGLLGLGIPVGYVLYSWWDFKKKVAQAEEAARQKYEQWRKGPQTAIPPRVNQHQQKLEDEEDELDEAIQGKKNWPFKEIKPRRVNGLDRSE